MKWTFRHQPSCTEETDMPESEKKQTYQPPRLTVYGDIRAITQNINDNLNMNDAIQGGNNLKT